MTDEAGRLAGGIGRLGAGGPVITSKSSRGMGLTSCWRPLHLATFGCMGPKMRKPPWMGRLRVAWWGCANLGRRSVPAVPKSHGGMAEYRPVLDHRR